MSCKSNIYVATTTATPVLAGANIPLATIVRRHLCELNQSGNSIAITDCGSNYYKVSVNATFTAPAAGDVTINLQQDGVNITGATATTTITTADTEVRSLSFTAIVRTFSGSNFNALTLVNAGVGATFSNVAISVEKL